MSRQITPPQKNQDTSFWPNRHTLGGKTLCCFWPHHDVAVQKPYTLIVYPVAQFEGIGWSQSITLAADSLAPFERNWTRQPGAIGLGNTAQYTGTHKHCKKINLPVSSLCFFEPGCWDGTPLIVDGELYTNTPSDTGHFGHFNTVILPIRVRKCSKIPRMRFYHSARGLKKSLTPFGNQRYCTT